MAAPEPLKLSGGRKDEEMFEARDLDIATDERQELDVENIPGELRYGSGEFRMIIDVFQTEWRENRPGLRRKR